MFGRGSAVVDYLMFFGSDSGLRESVVPNKESKLFKGAPELRGHILF